MQSWMIGTVAGVFAVGWMPELTPLNYCLGATASAVLLACWRRTPVSWFLMGLTLGFCYGTAWGYSLLSQRIPSALEGQTLTLQGAILDLPQWRRFSGGGQRQRFAFELDEPVCPADSSDCLPAGSKILLSWYGVETLKAGQRWRWQAKLKRPWGLANPGSFNYQAWLAQHRFSATGSIREQGAVQLLSKARWWQPHQQLRQYLAGLVPTNDSASNQVLRALTLGDRSAISANRWRQLQRFGLNHLVVISGLHVGMVAAVGFYLGLALGRAVCLLRPGSDSYISAQVVAACMALAYSALAGFALPTIRALVMLACIQLVSLCKRRLSLWRALQAALLAVALLDPLATHNAGFWLSFGAVALIAWLMHAWPHLRGLRRFLLLQLGLSLATGLLASHWFGGGSWLAPLANLVAVPVVTVLVAPLALLGGILAPLWQAAAQWCWFLAAWPVAAFFTLANVIEDAGLNPWIAHQPGSLAALLSLLAILIVLLPPGLPLRWLAIPLLLPQFLPQHTRLEPGAMELTVFDVGQGLSALVRTSDAAILYDTGAGDPQGPNMATSVILPYLRHHGVDKLQLLVISHGDRDHASGVHSLAQSLEIDDLWYGEQPFALGSRDSPAQQACRAGKRRRYGTLTLLQLHPQPDRDYTKSNNSSCVLLLEFSGYRLLFPGDIGKTIELELRQQRRHDLSANLLLAPHHGSLSSSSTPFIRAVEPEIVVFSAAHMNRFQHPRPQVVARYRRADVQVWETAKTGALTFLIEAGTVQSVTAHRRQRAYYWH